MTRRILNSRNGRLAALGAVLALVAGVLVWRAPDLGAIEDAFTTVYWAWVAAAVFANLASTWLRALAWQVTLEQALPEPHPAHRNVFSSFSVGLIANVALPGRVGEFARVGVLSRHIPDGAARWPAVAGSIIAHRVLDVVPTAGLAVYVLVVARLPGWADTGVYAVLAVGGVMLVAAILLATRRQPMSLDGKGRLARLLHIARRGLTVFRRPGAALTASALQLTAWGLQLLAVWLALRAFGIEEPIAAAALVLLVVNVALAFPLWPSAVGLYQAGVALAVLPYGISYHHGFVAGVGIQAIEVFVGVGLGLIFLAREGLSFASLRQLPRATDRNVRMRPPVDDVDGAPVIRVEAEADPECDEQAIRTLRPSSLCRKRTRRGTVEPVESPR